MQFFLKILGAMANSVDPDQTAPSGAVLSMSTQFACAIFVRSFGVQTFRKFTIPRRFSVIFMPRHQKTGGVLCYTL